MTKAREMVASASKEIYIRLFPEEGQLLDTHLKEACSRNVSVKYISMKTIPIEFDCQVIHPKFEPIEEVLGGWSLDLVSGSQEFPGGLFKIGDEESSSLYWEKNRWLVTAGRDSLRHDFFHYFLHKTYCRKQDLSEREKKIFNWVMSDA